MLQLKVYLQKDRLFMATGNNLFSNFYELLRYSWQARRKNKSAKDGRYEYQVRLEVIFFFFF